MIIKVSNNRLYSCVFTAVIFSFLLNINIEVHSRSFVSLSCDENKLPYECNDGAKHTISDKIYMITVPVKPKNGEGSSLTLPAAIGVQEPNTVIQAMRIEVKGTAGVEDIYGAVVSRGGKIVLSDSAFKNVSVGLKADHGIIEVNRGTIEASQVAAYAEKVGASVTLTNTKIKVDGQGIGQESALFINADAGIQMKGGFIDVNDAAALYVERGGRAILDGVTITSKRKKIKDRENTNEKTAYTVLNVKQQGSVYLKNTNIVSTNVHVLTVGQDFNTQSAVGRGENILISRVNIEDSTIKAIGNKHGMRFETGGETNVYEQGLVFLKRTVFEVPAGTAIHNNNSRSYIAVTEGTKIFGDLLLTAEKGGTVAILADSSSLIGGTYVADDSIAELYLTGGSKWFLTRRREIDSQVSNPTSSFISFVKLSDSFIAFETPMFHEYQTLHIGKGEKEVYSAQDSADIYLNTYLRRDGLLNNKKTDRLLIHGDVSGKTTVYVQFIAEDQREIATGENAHSVSLIQVSGKAAEDSFQLNRAYIALEGLPYQYYLNGYGPASSLGQAQTSQRLVEGEGDFWDFRFESKYIQPALGMSVIPHSELKIREVVPQVPTYLLLQNALFHVGLMDISNQQKQLQATRSISGKLLKVEENFSLSVHGYGGSYRYVSDLSLLEYGYDGNVDYNAIETDILLKTIERAYSTISFGIMGTYGKLSLQPRNVEQSQKSPFNKWTFTAYGSVKHNTGFYGDGLLSYGLFKGDVLTHSWGKTATLTANPLSISLSAGKVFMIGQKGLLFDPQIQFIYQYLQFDKFRDTDGIDVEMKKADQWLMRIGGYLSKTFTAYEKDRIISLNGNLHLAHHFGEKQFVHLKDVFQLGAFGSSLETGLGINAQLSSKVTLYSDFSYQHKLTKAGFSGVRFSGGLRYHF
ncbi:autotransporter outer membrane beta-barrel domain-containing protein [Bartonella krasnovii]|uniref:Autotransporter outer membrane beta-barrel domain-containing protein n=1 Tax=Bartonella krasnovii TaxID=2267275 RepID=A0A5B9D0I2_9HYPH|nr:autotransporter outer membrane beta-barrel domain-containing protein [Bartonella krasnovii]QEE12027.1 autotransporter outer membrane beta-barrel domain-containing protein [Bartonella krasnovii]UNF42838.1 autotransporter outer membrane beta-barrel domain-containing protein [Bartonella krasnovii]UNF54349.1 autotransporter outer membrane beta-barrel domain-containing protein [Bartonella krasnovii]UNF56048.1 autotransporter outer membrane beta-barrel domain-containing protein [Bartonella krasnov